MLVLEYTLTEKEYLDYHYYTSWQSPDKKSARLKYYLFFLVIYTILIGFFLYSSTGGFTIVSLLVTAIVVTGLFFLFKYRTESVFKKRARKLLSGSGSENILSATTLTINENGAFGKTNVVEVKYNWSAFHKKIIINDCYYLYISKIQALVIPIRAFRSQQERADFEKLLQQYFPLQAELTSISQQKS